MPNFLHSSLKTNAILKNKNHSNLSVLLMFIAAMFTAVVASAQCPSDNAGNYSGSWANLGGGIGFGTWVVTTATGGGTYLGNSGNNDNGNTTPTGGDINSSNGDAWGMYTSGTGNVSAYRTITNGLAIGQTLNFSMDIGNITAQSEGFSLESAGGGNGGNLLSEVYFTGGNNDFTLSDGTGTGQQSALPFTYFGINVSITVTSSSTYSITISERGNSNTVTLTNRSFITASKTPAVVRFFDYNTGSGSGADFFVNNLSITSAAPTSPSTNSPIYSGTTLNLSCNGFTNATETYAWSGPNSYIASVQDPSITNATPAAAGTYSVTATINSCASVAATTAPVVINTTTNIIKPLPAGIADGINYYPSPDSVTLVLYAPNKSQVIVVGDFNNWVNSSTYRMYETPDGLRYWITISGLTSGTEYAYQYVIDNSIQVADYNTQKVLDKNVDPQIPSSTYPNLKTFPSQASGTLASVFQTGQTPYKWQVSNFTRPSQSKLVIYELLMRDFTAAQNWQTVQDTLTYLKRLGINAIEVMPFCNFEGYSSWGYNPNFYFAPDKVYGTATALKQFVDACHADGIAVIMDLCMDDVFGSSPLAAMYWNSTTNTPASNNPWLDSVYTHPYADGNQFNHDAPATIALRKRVYAYWLDSFKLDGFRFDLAGGYTQTNSCSDVNFTCTNSNAVNQWNEYDQDRINALDSVSAEVKAISSTAYAIYEIFVNLPEEQIYVNQGDLVWSTGDNNSAFTQSTMGYPTSGGDFSNALYSTNFSNPGQVTYMESHDETVGGDERVMFKNESYGNSSGSYNVKTLATGLSRTGAAAAFWAMMPGPKMMWMFEELGYDFSPDACSNQSLNCGSTDPKPIPWGSPLNYNTTASRVALFNVYSQLLALRNVPNFAQTFSTGSINHDFSSYIKWLSVWSDSLQVMVMANFDVNQQTYTVSFPSAGNWYNFFTGTDTTVASTNYTNVTLQPGQYAVYVNRNLSSVQGLKAPLKLEEPVTKSAALWNVYPNPATGATYFHAQSDLGNVQLQLLDMSGRVLYKNDSRNMLNGSGAAIPVLGLAHGMYFLKINADKASGMEKILVQ
jgi:1,4-alpha-glucan branching enzyme